MSIDLESHLLREVRAILKEHVPECEVWAFGSRVGSSHPKRFSDLDLAVVSTGSVPVRRLALLVNAFEESDLPVKVDVVDWQTASPALRQQIAEEHEVIFRPSQPPEPSSRRSRARAEG